MVLRFVEGYYRERDATVGAFFLTKRLTVDNLTCKLLLWDTAGEEQFQRLAATYYQKASAAILCFDISNPQSLERMKSYLHQVQECERPLVVAIAACKGDLKAAPGIEQEAIDIATSIGSIFVKTSAKDDRQVSDLFRRVTERILQQHGSLSTNAIHAMDRSPPSVEKLNESDATASDSDNDGINEDAVLSSSRPVANNATICESSLMSCGVVTDQKQCCIM